MRAMDPVKSPEEPLHLARNGPFSLDRLLSHIDPGPADETEEFVRRIYEHRHLDRSSGRDGSTGG